MQIGRLHAAWRPVIIGFAIYPIISIGFVGLLSLGFFAEKLHLSTDTVPLFYGLAFAALTFVMVDLLGIASVVLALISCANLIEYAQLVIPGRNASAIDFAASLAGVIVAAVMVWAAHALANRPEPD